MTINADKVNQQTEIFKSVYIHNVYLNPTPQNIHQLLFYLHYSNNQLC